MPGKLIVNNFSTPLKSLSSSSKLKIGKSPQLKWAIAPNGLDTHVQNILVHRNRIHVLLSAHTPSII